MPRPDFSDRRKHNRYKSNITSLCIRRNEDNSNLEVDILPIKNIAVGGVFVQTDVPYRKGTVIDIQFIIPGYHKPVVIKGKVAWSDGSTETPGMGVEIISISKTDKEALAAYFDSIKFK